MIAMQKPAPMPDELSYRRDFLSKLFGLILVLGPIDSFARLTIYLQYADLRSLILAGDSVLITGVAFWARRHDKDDKIMLRSARMFLALSIFQALQAIAWVAG